MKPATKEMLARQNLALEAYRKHGLSLTADKWREIYQETQNQTISRTTAFKDTRVARQLYIQEIVQDDSFYIDQVHSIVQDIENYRHTNPNGAIGLRKLLSEWFDFPSHIQRIINHDAENTIPISEAEYKEFLQLKAEKNNGT